MQEGRNHALIVVDLDKFKYANDTFGHLFGDSVIKAVAATLRATFRATDIVGRTGGDEFVVLAKDISLSDGLETLKAKCRRLSVELAHVSLGQDYVISASIGISLFPRDGKTYAELFAKADAALYQIKNTGRGHFAVYARNGNKGPALGWQRDASHAPRATKRRLALPPHSGISINRQRPLPVRQRKGAFACARSACIHRKQPV